MESRPACSTLTTNSLRLVYHNQDHNKIPQSEGIISSSVGNDIVSMDSGLLTLYKENRITAETALEYAANLEILKRKM